MNGKPDMSGVKQPDQLGRWHCPAWSTRLGRPRLRQVVLVLPVVGALLAGLALLLAGLRPVCRTELVPLWVGGPTNGLLPAVPWADQDREALCSAALYAVIPAPLDQPVDRSQVIETLRGLRARRSASTLVVYLAGPACRDARGRVHILPEAADLDDPATWLPLGQVLESLRQCPHRHRLLVLDIACPAENPGTALTTADALTGINDELAAVPDPERLVLTSCAPGQVSQYSEVLGRSVFSYYFERAIRGEAEGARSSRDGQITAGELADYVRDRVSRWALHARLVQQEPMLLGEAADFPVITLPKNRLGVPDTVGAREYPAWLREAWQQRALDASPEGIRARRALLAAERAWRCGERADAVKKSLAHTLASGPTLPRVASPPALCLARAAHKPADPMLLDRLAQLQLEMEARTRGQSSEQASKIREALKAQFLAEVKKRPLLEVAQAIIEQAYRLAAPPPETLAILVELLDALESKPQFVETLVLREIAAASARRDGPKAQIVGRMLDLLALSQLAAAKPVSSAWVRELREKAAEKGHEAMVLGTSPGHIAPSLAESLLDMSLDEYRIVQAEQDEVEQAQTALDDTRRWLVDALSALQRTSLVEDDWQSAVNAAVILGAHLDQARDDQESSTATGDLTALTAVLKSHREQLLRPLTSEELNRLLLDARRPGADAATWRTLDTLLAIPWWDGVQRVKVWEALRDLERRLHQQVDCVAAGSVMVQPAPVLSRVFPPGPHDPVALGKRQAQLLRLGGADPTTVTRLDKLLENVAHDRAARLEAARILRQTWDRLQTPLFDEQGSDLWGWLADWYRYKRREHEPTSLASEFYARAAHLYQDWLRTAEQYVVIRPLATQAELPPDQTAELKFTVQTGPGDRAPGPVKILVLTPDNGALEVVPKHWTLEPSVLEAGPCLQTFSVRLRSDALAGGVPEGVLVQARFQGRAYHAFMALPFRAPGPEILLCPAGAPLAAPLSDIKLRPVRGTQGFSVWLRNPGGLSWPQLTAEVLAGGDLVGAATLALGAHETRRVTFAPVSAKTSPPGKPAADSRSGSDGKPGANGSPDAQAGQDHPALPAFVPPLVIRVRSPERPERDLSARTVPITVLPPDAYVEFGRSQFEARSEAGRASTRLEVLLRLSQVQGPPFSTAELVVGDRNPKDKSAQAVQDGTIQGVIPSDGNWLRLSVKNMALGAAENQAARLCVRVDDWKRAFVLRAAPAQSAAPALAQPDKQPAVRLLLPPWALAAATLPVPVEVDNPPPGSKLEVVVGHLAGGAFVPEKQAWRGPAWEERVGFRVRDGSGDLDFTAGVDDPVAVLDTAGVRGPREVRARLLDASGQEIASTSRGIVFSDAPPAKPRFVDPPLQAWRKAPLRLKASGADPATPIEEVTFFVGQPEGGKRPATAVAASGRPLNKQRTLWEGQLPLPADKTGPVPISVEFTNALGLSQFDTTTVTLEENDPRATMPGRIEGRVLEGNRPQSGLDVVLTDEKGARRGKATTRQDGQFMLRDVAPGKYRLTCRKPSNQRVGTFPREPGETLEVRPGEAVVADILLYMP